MRKYLSIKVTDLILILLFISTMLVGFIFVGTDTEYNMNQQIARGYISRDAVFFEIDNPSYTKHSILQMTVDMNGNISDLYVTDGADFEIDDEGVIVINNNNVPAKDPDFILENPVFDSGLTAIETLLSSSNNIKYFSSLHSGMLRGIYYIGDIELPPVTSGRFISQEECLNKTPVAVIGRNYIDDTYEYNNKRYLDYLNKKYEVVGIVGLSGSSPLDSLIFVNLGSLTPKEQLNGIYYIDSSSSNQKIYEEFESKSTNLLKCDLKQRSIPLAEIDTVSGGMYLKGYLKFIMIGLFLFTFVNIFIQNLRQQHSKIAILKVLGVSNIKILIATSLKTVIEQIAGILIGTLLIYILVAVEYFSLPVSFLLILSSLLILCTFIMLFIWVVITELVIILTNPRKVIQKI